MATYGQGLGFHEIGADGESGLSGCGRAGDTGTGIICDHIVICDYDWSLEFIISFPQGETNSFAMDSSFAIDFHQPRGFMLLAAGGRYRRTPSFADPDIFG